MGDDTPIDMSYRWVSLAGSNRQLSRRSVDACLYCGRRDGPERWKSPNQAARWGRIAVVVAMVAPIFYALTRYRLGAGDSAGDERGVLASRSREREVDRGDSPWRPSAWWEPFSCLVWCSAGAKIFPRWMIGLAGRRVPIALAVVPASLASVLLIVGGIGIWSGLPQMVANATAAGGAWEQNSSGKLSSSSAPPCCSRFGGWRLRWRRWATITGGAARAGCAVVGQIHQPSCLACVLMSRPSHS